MIKKLLEAINKSIIRERSSTLKCGLFGGDLIMIKVFVTVGIIAMFSFNMYNQTIIEIEQELSNAAVVNANQLIQDILYETNSNLNLPPLERLTIILDQARVIEDLNMRSNFLQVQLNEITRALVDYNLNPETAILTDSQIENLKLIVEKIKEVKAATLKEQVKIAMDAIARNQEMTKEVDTLLKKINEKKKIKQE